MNQWQGRKVAFLGDSITDKCHVGTTKNYWQFLEEYLGIQPLVYGINGDQWIGLYAQAEKLKAEHGSDVDAIIVFVGTNDFNGSVPIGEWWSFREEEANSNGVIMKK
ncbi:MAG: GDSL-type esterase/lipase family protein, partial [Lentisphaeria bacterium]|nr:GDSL-type esterase/lipase family protein [Lentisphaeria bacterium]